MKRKLITGLSFVLPAFVYAQGGNMNMQGSSGLLNVPDASVLEFGTAMIAWDNQVDGRFVSPNSRNGTGNDFKFAAGAFPHFEMVGRNVAPQTTAGSSDLSFNIKLQLPWELLPGLNFAIGEMDFGGAVNEYDTKYAAATWEYGIIRSTVGVGSYDGRTKNTGRLDGVFAGIEAQATDWLSVMLEDDAYSINAGVRLSTPKQWLPSGWRASMLLMYSAEEGVDNRQDWYAFNVSIPLAAEYERALPKHRQRVNTGKTAGYVSDPVLLENPLIAPPSGSSTEAVAYRNARSGEKHLRDRFMTADFEKVRVQKYGREWVIAFENLRYDANDIDALGVAAGIAASSLPAGDRFYLQLEKYGVVTFGLGGDVSAWKEFLTNGGAMPASEMITAPSSKLRRRSEGGIVNSVVSGVVEYLAFRPNLMIAPVVKSTVGSEYGVLDYSLAARGDLQVPLWPGAAFNVTSDLSVYETKDYTDKGVNLGVFRPFGVSEGVKDRFFSQVLRHGSGFTSMVSYGRFFEFSDGISLESRWEPGDGRHRLSILATDFDDKRYDDVTHNARLASYRYFAQSTNTELNIIGGEFYNEDSGYQIDLVQHIGDVRLFIAYKTSEDDSFASLGFTVPLTPRKGTTRFAGVHLEGQANWTYGLSTLLGHEVNHLRFGTNVIPREYNSLHATYFNGDRLNGAYVRANQERLVDAWRRYGGDK